MQGVVSVVHTETCHRLKAHASYTNNIVHWANKLNVCQYLAGVGTFLVFAFSYEVAMIRVCSSMILCTVRDVFNFIASH